MSDMQAPASPRQPHAVLDLPSRVWKGQKIEQLLRLSSRAQPIRMLEVGTGSGGIAHYFGTHPQLRCDVTAVDVVDSRLVTDGYVYQEVRGTELPFADACFDVVISNHVIEHVGDEAAQRLHLAELHRVLSLSGIGYLAVPNRWMLTEPHYRLKFLSWWPRPLRTPYLRLMGRGACYDCEPLQLRQLEHMLADAGFRHENACIEAWRATLNIEQPQSFGARFMRSTPDVLLAPLKRVIPTLIYRIERA